MSLTKETLPPLLNLVHPRPAEYRRLLEAMHDTIIEKKRLRQGDLTIIPYQNWLERLESFDKQEHWSNNEKLKDVVRVHLLTLCFYVTHLLTTLHFSLHSSSATFCRCLLVQMVATMT